MQRALRPFDCFLARFDALLCNVACAFPSADVLLGTLDLFVQFSGGSVERCDVEITACNTSNDSIGTGGRNICVFQFREPRARRIQMFAGF